MNFRPTVRLGLRTRFLAAMLALTLVLLAGFVYAISGLVHVIENQVFYSGLERHAGELSALYERYGYIPDLHQPGLKTWVVPRGETADLPAEVADLAPDRPREVSLPDVPYQYGGLRRDLGAVSLYVVMDMTPIERLEDELVAVGWLAGLSALLLAVLLALWLSWIVIRPVRALAARVGQISPGRERPELKKNTGDHELDIIVEAFDNVLDRFDDFVAREQAFTEDASHELRTPLATIMSTMDLLATDASLSTKAQTRLTRARTAAIHMQELVEALLLIARGDANHDEPPVAVAPIVREAIALQTHTPEGGGKHKAEVVLDVRAGHQVNAPGSMVLSVVNNLLRNAMEHSGPEQIEITLDGSHLSLRDHGDGMTPAILSRVFDRRFHGANSRGYGLGLYIVKRICDRFGWTIEVHSRPGAGTQFDLYLLADRSEGHDTFNDNPSIYNSDLK